MDLEDTLPLTFNPDSIIISKDNPDLIIVTGSNGMTDLRRNFRSSDSGVTWVPIKETFYSVMYNYATNELYATDTHSLFRSTDFGTSWEKLGGDGGNSFTIEGVFPEVYFENIVVYNNKGFVLTNGTSFKVDFANGGAVVLNKDGLDYLVNAAISEKDASYVYASSWARLFMLEGINLKPIRDIGFVQELLISPNDPSVLFAKISGGDEGRTLTYASYDCGKTLEALPRTKQPYSIISLTFDPQNPSIIYAIGSEDNDARLYHYKSEDSGKSFTKISENFIAGSPVDILSISMFDSSIYIYGENSGIFKSDDLGKTFEAFDKGIGKIPNIGIVALEFNPKTKDIFLLTKSHGLFMLKNGSNTWVDISGSLPKDKISALAVDKKTGRVFIGVNGIGIFELIE